PMALSQDGKTLAVCETLPDGRDIVSLWRLGPNKVTHLPISIPAPPMGLIECMAFSPDGKILATGAVVKISLWDTAPSRLSEPLAHRKCPDLKGQAGLCIAFSPDGKLVASGGMDATIRFWDSTNGEPMSNMHGHEARITSIAFEPGGKTLASAS